MAIDHPAQPVNFAGGGTEIPFLLTPDSTTLFAVRAARLKNLAHGHAMEAYLGFIAEVAAAQQHALDAFPRTALPAASSLQPLLAASTWPRSPAWRQALQQIVQEISGKATPGFSSKLGNLAHAPEADLENWAQAIVAGNFDRLDKGLLPVVAAGLQVYWMAMAGNLDAASISRQDSHDAALCPVCGSLPIGSVVRNGAATAGLRYLVCSLCSSQWNMERIRCVNCGDSKNVVYYAIEGSDGAIQVEACNSCYVYTKIMHLEKNPALDIVADDLATLALDILVGEAGYQRYGLNPFLVTETEAT